MFFEIEVHGLADLALRLAGILELAVDVVDFLERINE